MPVRKKHDRGGEVKEKEKEEVNHDKIKVRKTKLSEIIRTATCFFWFCVCEQIVIKNQNIS